MRRSRLAALGFLIVALVSLPPLFFGPGPVQFISPASAWMFGTAGKATVLAIMLVCILGRAWLDQRAGEASIALALALAFLAALLLMVHWAIVDNRWVPDRHAPNGRNYFAEGWQREHYIQVLDHRKAYAPHVYRPLPYGFIRTLERATGDWDFARDSYRWFFTYWFLWAYVQFARRFLTPMRATLALAAYLVLYPLSIAYYLGQPTDPMSHAFFVLAYLYILDDRWLELAAALALGVMAKETAMILVPAYWTGQTWSGRSRLVRTIGLAAVCIAAYLAVRLPWGWGLNFASINNSMLMIRPNLGLPSPDYIKGMAPQVQNYIQPLLFVGLFLPFIGLRWRDADPRLRILFLTVTPLLLGTNLCFGWLYESRNYVPLLPLCTCLALTPRKSVRGLNPNSRNESN